MMFGLVHSNGPSTHGWKPLKPGANINSFLEAVNLRSLSQLVRQHGEPFQERASVGYRWVVTRMGQPCHVLACFGLILGFYSSLLPFRMGMVI